MASALARALCWRGPTNDGLMLWKWLVFIGLAWPVSRLLGVVEPLLILVAPFVEVAVAVPAATAALRLAPREAFGRSAFDRAEPFLLCGALAGLTWGMWGYLAKQNVFADSFDQGIMMERADEYTARILRGEWPEYSHFAEGGDSRVDLYPSLANLIALVFRVLLPKGTPFAAAYTAMVVFAWWFRGVAAYHLSRRFAAPWIAAFVTAFSLLEVGQDVWDGVWNGSLYFGMIHSHGRPDSPIHAGFAGFRGGGLIIGAVRPWMISNTLGRRLQLVSAA